MWSANSLGVVLKYLRVNGFTDTNPKFQHQGQAGIQKRGEGYIVATKGEDGKKHLNSCKSLNEALQTQLEVDEWEDVVRV